MKKVIFLCCLFQLFTVTLFCQSLSVFDVDTSGFPTIKTKFFAFDKDGNQITNLSTSDFQLNENGQLRNVSNVSCPSPIPPIAISSVLVMDVSGSMCGDGLNIAKAAANAWINILPLGRSECAITSFSDDNYINQDFTTNKTKLINSINSLVCMGGTDYNAAMIDPPGGGVLIAKTGKHKRVIVFLSDGGPNSEPNTSQIISEANANNISIFSVSLDTPAPQCMKDFANQTDGIYFENIRTKEEAEACFIRILQIAQGGDPCEIEWLSEFNCTGGTVNIDCKLIPYNINTTANYRTPAKSIAYLECKPTSVFFKIKSIGIPVDTNIILTARNSDFNITNITSSDPNFDVNPKSFTLQKGKSQTISLRYIPIDSNRYYTTITFENDLCKKKYYAVGSLIKKATTTNQTLKVTHPNGGENFVIGSDTMITWEGVLPGEKVKLEFSSDNGNTWNLITDITSGLSFKWKNIPKPASNQCLVRAIRDKSVAKDAPDIEWAKCYGGNSDDKANSIQETNDGGYIIAGWARTYLDSNFTVSHNSVDAWVVKTNSSGAIEWERCYGGSDADVASSIKVTTDGGYIFAGYTYSNDGDVSGNHGGLNDAWVVKLNSIGDIQWQRCIGGSERDEVYDVEETQDGGFIVIGITDSNNGDISNSHGNRECLVVKLNSMGTIVWQKGIGGRSGDYGNDLQVTSDGGFILVGSTSSSDGDVSGNDGSDIWIVKLDSNRNIEWQKFFGGMSSSSSIQETSDGGFILGGQTLENSLEGYHTPNDPEHISDCLVVKLNKTGTMQWYKCLGGSNSDWAISARETSEGGFIVAGITGSDDGDVSGMRGSYDYWVVKLNILGEIEWQKCLGGGNPDISTDIKETSDGGFIIAGYTESIDGDVSENHSEYGNYDYWIVKLCPIVNNFQQDLSDSVFSIVSPQIATFDIDMKMALVGTFKDSIITGFITNTGSYPCRINSISFEGRDYDQYALVSGFPPFTIDVGNSKSVEFRFKPNSAGNKSSTIVIITQSDTLRQRLIGEGVIPVLSVENKLVDFGKVLVGNIKDTLAVAMIKNIGTASITIDSTKHNKPNDYDFSTISGSAPFTLNPDETAIMDLRFNPSDVCRTSGVLEFYYNGVGSPAVITLYGEGVSDTVSVPDVFSNITGNVQLFLINPNPASDEAEIEIELIESERTQLFLTNILGEKVLTLMDRAPDLGRQKIRINTNDLSQGNYFVILKTPTVIKTQRLAIVK